MRVDTKDSLFTLKLKYFKVLLCGDQILNKEIGTIGTTDSGGKEDGEDESSEDDDEEKKYVANDGC